MSDAEREKKCVVMQRCNDGKYYPCLTSSFLSVTSFCHLSCGGWSRSTVYVGTSVLPEVRHKYRYSSQRSYVLTPEVYPFPSHIPLNLRISHSILGFQISKWKCTHLWNIPTNRPHPTPQIKWNPTHCEVIYSMYMVALVTIYVYQMRSYLGSGG